MAYFNVRQVWIPENQKLEKIVGTNFPDVRFSEYFYEILFISASNQELLNTVLSAENSIQNDSIVIIDAIHTDKERNGVWNSIKMHEKVTVTIDMFHCGAVFFRKEQAKEHFKVRI